MQKVMQLFLQKILQLLELDVGKRVVSIRRSSQLVAQVKDSIEEAARNGIGAIIQPGGSIRDEEVIAKANELQIPMVTTGIRGFKH